MKAQEWTPELRARHSARMKRCWQERNDGRYGVDSDWRMIGVCFRRAGETPEQILNRLATALNCEPRQVCDRVIRMLEERKKS